MRKCLRNDRNLLNQAHPHDKSKAGFFYNTGYTLNVSAQLQNDLARFACIGKVEGITSNNEGTKYVVTGNFESINGKIYPLKTIWIVEDNNNRPRLITAYPN